MSKVMFGFERDQGDAVDAIIFDAANTVLENPSGFSPRKEAARLLQLPSAEYVRNLVYTLSADQPGMSERQFAETLVTRATGQPDPRLVKRIHEIWEQYNAAQRLRPDSIGVLRELRKRRKRLALVPNCTPFFKSFCRTNGFDELFDTIVLSCDAGLLKPDPRIFHMACQQVGVEPRNACVVGDKVKTDILGGVLAGCHTVLLETRYSQPVSHPKLPVHAVISRLSDLLHLPIMASSQETSGHKTEDL